MLFVRPVCLHAETCSFHSVNKASCEGRQAFGSASHSFSLSPCGRRVG